ncbi:helix-turn-helix domain-containing protein [Streptomyces sp. NPDC001339]|uniref:helix-turn-helix domain-containing protein n=1 Tax=Streptomyces sp. NPDC001339 TaxID=3364563 RepID=UPI003682A349
MQGYFPPQEGCKNCGAQLTPQRTGRPGEYCGTACRQAAYRRRRKEEQLDTAALDRDLNACAQILEAEVQQLFRALEEPHVPGEAGPLTTLVEIQQHVERMLPGAVGRARHRGVSWARIADVLSLNKDSVRRKYGKYDVGRHLQRIARPRQSVPPSPAASWKRGPGNDDDADTHRAGTPDAVDTGSTGSTGSTGPTGPASGQVPSSTGLAPVLSHLQRASRLSLRSLGERTSLSASHLSRILSGERFPDWSVTARIARACGADPCALRKVWEDAETRRGTKRRGELSLDSALRYLHRRAGTPSTWSMAVASSGILNRDEITAMLDGTAVPDWDIVERLIMVLDGEPAYFAPLWKSAHNRPTPSPPPATGPSPRPPRTRTRVRAATQLEEMLAAFSAALSSSHPLPVTPGPLPTAAPATPSPPLRPHPMPAPIPALANWGNVLQT